MNEVKAPLPYGKEPRPWFFLAGSIEMGTAEDWQAQFRRLNAPGTILNPRRDDWDSSWVQSIDNPQFFEQVTWELEAMERCDAVLLYLCPGTKSPISLLELGRFYRKVVVCCPEGFWRKGNVDVFCRRYGVAQVENLHELEKRILCHEGCADRIDLLEGALSRQVHWIRVLRTDGRIPKDSLDMAESDALTALGLERQ